MMIKANSIEEYKVLDDVKRCFDMDSISLELGVAHIEVMCERRILAAVKIVDKVGGCIYACYDDRLNKVIYCDSVTFKPHGN